MVNSTCNYRATTILFICGQNIDIDFVNQSLNLLPEVVKRQGEAVMPSLTNGGQRDFDSRMNWDRWSRSLTSKQLNQSLHQQLKFWLQTLSPARSAFQEFERRDYWSVLDCQLVPTKPYLPSIQFRLSKEVQAKFTKLGIDVDFTIYLPSE
ncbi:DUF4279 domain-containing protein [Leptolyngbya sp. GGD]|uniref:DUF4279 domain-containing protein n=1 Tax=Leptolyngbya sp. GGD TaxID=2997907 RepID=UPI00227D3289|nr:DUF4279 domain-containing protein [Leptolyngbya sp. GGD]MCY6493938.1 DUF4279 domain-containing protein [Leptolyngbya sp. GGD]